MDLVGLSSFIDKARDTAGHPIVVGISGFGGSGKSTLARALVERSTSTVRMRSDLWNNVWVTTGLRRELRATHRSGPALLRISPTTDVQAGIVGTYGSVTAPARLSKLAADHRLVMAAGVMAPWPGREIKDG